MRFISLPKFSPGWIKPASTVAAGGGVAFRSSADSSYANELSTFPKPSGVVDGDILIASLWTTDGNMQFGEPVGWTPYSGVDGWPVLESAVGGDWRLHTFWKRASSEPASWDWTHDSPESSFGRVSAFSGAVASGDPNDATYSANTAAASTSLTGLSITTATNNALAIMFYLEWNSNRTGTPPSGWTEVGQGLSGFGCLVKTFPTAGATGNIVYTLDTAGDYDAFVIALKP